MSWKATQNRLRVKELIRLLPKGSKDPNNRVLGPKNYNIHGLWAVKTLVLGPLGSKTKGGPEMEQRGLGFRGTGLIGLMCCLD